MPPVKTGRRPAATGVLDLGAGWGESGAEPGLTGGLIDNPGSKVEEKASQPVILAGALAARESERCIDLDGLEVARPAVPRARPR